MLTAKQEAFCLEFVKGIDASKAYRSVYDCAKSSDKTVWRSAKQLMDNPKVSARIAELRKPAAEAAQYDLQQAMLEAEEIRVGALKDGKFSAAASAVQLKAKMNGLLVEERKNQRTPLQELTDEQLDAYSDRLADQHAAITGTRADPAGTRTTH